MNTTPQYMVVAAWCGMVTVAAVAGWVVWQVRRIHLGVRGGDRARRPPRPKVGTWVPEVVTHEGATWVPCPCCPDYQCTVHGLHAHECDCPPIEEWGTVDPYSQPPPAGQG